MRQKIVQLLGRVLKRELNVIQAGGLERGGARFRQAHARGQQVGVIPQAMRLGDQHFQVIAQHRLATREAALHAAGLARLAQHAQPVVGR